MQACGGGGDRAALATPGLLSPRNQAPHGLPAARPITSKS